MSPLIIPKFFTAEQCEKLVQQFNLHEKFPHRGFTDRDAYLDRSGKFFQINKALEPYISMKVGTSVLATYAYVCDYIKGSKLPKHTDKPECQYTVSVTIGSRPAGIIWPLYIEGAAANLSVGDAVLYSGTESKHWREPMPPELEQVTQLLFHYIPV